jgi:hypothetical protein
MPRTPSTFSRSTEFLMPGIVAAALFVFARQQIRREQERADRLEAQLTQLHGTTADKVIPALVAATQVLEDTQNLLRDLAMRDRGLHP